MAAQALIAIEVFPRAQTALYFQRVLSYSAVETGIAFLPFAIMLTAANVVGGRCVARFGSPVTMISGLLLAATGCAFHFGISQHTTYVAILPGQLLIRLGIGLAVPAMTTGVLSAVQSARSGVASGTLNAVRQAGGAIGVAMFGALMATDMVWGMRTALVLSGLLLLAAAMVSFASLQVPQEQDAQSSSPGEDPVLARSVRHRQASKGTR